MGEWENCYSTILPTLFHSDLFFEGVEGIPLKHSTPITLEEEKHTSWISCLATMSFFTWPIYFHLRLFPCGLAGTKSACNARHLGLIPELGRSPGEGKRYIPTPVFWPGEFHGLSMGLQRVGHNWATFTRKTDQAGAGWGRGWCASSVLYYVHKVDFVSCTLAFLFSDLLFSILQLFC